MSSKKNLRSGSQTKRTVRLQVSSDEGSLSPSEADLGVIHRSLTSGRKLLKAARTQVEKAEAVLEAALQNQRDRQAFVDICMKQLDDAVRAVKRG